MKNRIPGIVPALLASFALPTSALAAGATYGGTTTATASSTCPSLCSSPPSATTCAQYAYQTCITGCTASTDPKHLSGECAPYLQPQYAAAYAQAAQQLASSGQPASKPVILPPAMAQRDAVALGTVFNALPIASNARSVITAGNGNNYQDSLWGLGFVGAVEYPRYSQDDEGIYRNLTMNSCAEYVWKKWGEISWFNDVAHTAGTNYGWVVDVVGAGTLGVVTGALTSAQRWDGLPIALNGTRVQFPTTIARNPFYGVAPNWLRTATDPTQQAIYQAFVQYAAQPDIAFPASTVLDEDWAAHEKKYLQEAGVAAATFADDERRMSAYQAIATQYQNDQYALTHYCDGWGTAIMYCARSPGYKAAQAVVAQDQQAITNALVAEWKYDARNGCLGYTFPVPGENGISSDYVSNQTSAGYTFRANSCDWSPHVFYRTFVDRFEPQVEAAMKRCIADTGDDFTALESAPSTLFREPTLWGAAFNHALTRGENDGTTYKPSATQSASDYANSTSMEQYFWDYENRDSINAAAQKAAIAVEDTYDTETTSLPLQGAPPGTAGQTTYIGQTVQDQNSIGGSWFGGGYSYWAKWSITPRIETSDQAKAYPHDPIPHICSLAGDVGAGLKVDASVLNNAVSILDAALEVTADPPATPSAPAKVTLSQAHFTILGNDYLADPLSKAGLKEGQTWSGKTFDFPLTETPFSPSYSVIIPVLFIPLEVSAGMTVKIGVDVNGSAQPPVYCDRNNVGFSMQGSIAPSAEVDAFAAVAVDLGLASAGVQGNLTIFKGAMPVTGSIKLSSGATSNPNQISLVVGTSGTLQMTELSGDVDLFAEVLGQRADVSLFSWDGFHQSVPLFNLTQSYPLIAVDYRIAPANLDASQ